MRILSTIMRFGRPFYLLLALVPFVLGALGYWLIVFVDPYGLRAEGLPPRLAEHRYPDEEWPLLIRVSTRAPHDLVLLGGSTTMGVTPQMLREAFPGVKNPINLSYVAPRPIDFTWVLDYAARIPGLKRVVLIMDFSLLERRPLRSAFGDTMSNMMTTSWSHGGDFSPDTALASLHRVALGTYDLPQWSRLTEPEFMKGATPLADSAAAMSRFRVAASRHLNDVFARTSLTCADIPFIDRVLTPFLVRMKRKGVAVDLVYPPVPYVLYYDWIDNTTRFNILLPGPVFDQFIVYKKCVIGAEERVGGDIQVVATDEDDAVSGDLRRYMDSVHLLDPSAYLAVMKKVAGDEDNLTSSNFGPYEQRLRAKVARTGSRLARGM